MKSIVICLAVLLVVSLSFAQDYVGDSACSGCHSGKYNDYMNSGHPYKVTRTAGQVPADGTWPWTPIPPLPVVYDQQLEWSDVEYVIGNYFWKARFIDRDGYIYTGDVDESTQWNLQLQSWIPYHAGEIDRPFNCGRCHTTGYMEEGNQHDLPGLVGTWAQDGIRCEACHGPASAHISNPQTHPANGKDCSECHYRDDAFRMPWSGGFMKHHQQAEDLEHSPHSNFQCVSCHEPHRSVVYNDGGIPDTFTCSSCHGGDEENSYYVIEGMEDLECVDCHMPNQAKSAGFIPENEYVGDVRGHLFQITTDPTAREDNTVEIEGSVFWAQDNDGDAYTTLDYACFGCHLGEMTLAAASDYSQNIHTSHATTVGASDFATLPKTFRITSVYPNPFNPTTTISFELDKPYIATLTVYDALGRTISELRSGPAKAGVHQITFDGRNHASGIYFVRLTTGAGSDVKKMILMK